MLQRLTYGKNYCAVEHTFDNTDKQVYNTLILQQQKKELQIKSKNQTFQFEDVIAQLKNQKHLFLILNNNHVLSKEFESINESPIIIVQNAFPNIIINDFYYEVVTTDNKSFIAIARKQEVDSLIKEYIENKVYIVGFSLGNLAIKNVLPFTQKNEICTSNSKIIISNSQLTSIEQRVFEKESYTINSLQVGNKDLLSLGGILHYYFNQGLISKGLKEIKNILKENYRQQRFFTLGLYAVLGILFSVLLVNFLVFSNYYTKINQLDIEVQQGESNKLELVQLQNQTKQKEILVTSLQSASNSKVSLYLNEIGKDIPNTILLSELQYQPILKRIKTTEKISIQNNKIIVKGVSKKNTDFNDLLDNLEAKNWVKDVIIVNYGKNKNTINSFEILIIINNA